MNLILFSKLLQILEFNHCRNFIFVVDNVVSGVKDFQENSLIIFLKTHRKEWIISGRYKKRKKEEVSKYIYSC